MLLVGLVTGAALVLGVPWPGWSRGPAGRRFWAVAVLPLVIPSYVAGAPGRVRPAGFLQQILEEPFGVERVPEIYGLPGAVLALTISTYPYVFLLAAAALRDLDPALEEASRSLGRSRSETFRRVTLPVLRPSLGAGALLVALYPLRLRSRVAHAATFHAGDLRPVPLALRPDAGRALALVLVVLTAIVLVLEHYARGASATVARRGRRGRREDLARRWRWPAFGFCAAVVGFALLLPLAVIVYWLERAVSLGRELGTSGARPSTPPASTLLRRRRRGRAGRRARGALPGRAGRGRSSASRTPSNALPGIVIALSLVFGPTTRASPTRRWAARLRLRRPLLPAGGGAARTPRSSASTRGSRRPPAAWGRARGRSRNAAPW